MRADSTRARWVGLMLATVLVSTGCVSLTPPSGRRMNLSSTPREAAPPASAEGPSVEPPRTLASPPEPEAPERLHPLRSSREAMTAAGPGSESGAARQSALAAHLAFLGAIGDVSGSTRRISGQLSSLKASHLGIAGRAAGVFLPYVAHGERHLRWIDAELAAATRLANAASQVDDPDMQLALLRLAGPRLEAAMLGSLLLAAWLDFLHLVDGEQAMLLAQLVEMVTLASTLKISLPRLPPSAPAMLGVGLVAGSNGVMMGTRLVISAEWVEMMRRLVQAGVISLPVVSAAVRIHAGQVMMTQSHDELPRGVREALGDGPEVRGMRVTGRAGAGMAEPPQHHVLPREHREWFEKRGFTGEMSIDQFCVTLEQSRHEAIHGGGNWANSWKQSRSA